MRKCVAKVAWGDVCAPKMEGGGGIPDIVVGNK